MGTMLKELRYSLYLTTHPFKGFWEIKHENRGSLRTAVFWLAAYTLLSVLSGFCTAYLFNQDGGVNTRAVFPLVHFKLEPYEPL